MYSIRHVLNFYSAHHITSINIPMKIPYRELKQIKKYTIEFRLTVSKIFSWNTKHYDKHKVPSRSSVVGKLCENIPEEKNNVMN